MTSADAAHMPHVLICRRTAGCTSAPHTLSLIDTHAGSGQDNSQVDALKCGRWAQNNDLYGGNALIPFLDFCQIAGNQCNPKGAAAARASAVALC